MFFISLILGIISWVIPLLSFNKNIHFLKPPVFCSLSFGCCGAAALLQFADIQLRIRAEDWAGIEDTLGSVMIGVAVLFIITIISNAIALKGARFN